ncbi:hypothetical protein BKA59DRAFT_560093 [Fusarium tricinctum]|uniref:F-box domain-containing protein n=1 Tax=Fusarium tricinctum TaxID=61284 RepID=A0A8K0RPM3_9HYPO|nr:hypothetical protein BKA59DRAFT_560093 [Fusarium tricinctum]
MYGLQIKQPYFLMMDIFATLPPELIAPILGNLPDLRSLYNIATSSPHVLHFLNSPVGAGVLDDVLVSSAENLATTPWMPHIMRLVALIRHCSPINQPASNLSAFVTAFEMPTTLTIVEDPSVPDLQAWPPNFTSRIRLSDVMRGPQGFKAWEIIFLAQKINALSIECFGYFHERIKATKPQHLTDKCYHLDTLPWNRRPDDQTWGESYKMNAGDGPSWYELQRIVLGFWYLQLCYELSNAASEGRLQWSSSDIETIRYMESAGKILPGPRGSMDWIVRESLWSVLVYVRDLEGLPDGGSCVGGTDDVNQGLSVFFSPGFKPLQDKHHQLPSPKRRNAALEWPTIALRPPPLASVTRVLTYHSEKVLTGCKGYHWAGPLLFPRGGSRLSQGLLFRPFRRLGFSIWDDERLVEMEMLDDPENRRPRRFHVWSQDQVFTWTSLLSLEEKEELRLYQEALQLKEEREFGELLIGGTVPCKSSDNEPTTDVYKN